MPSDLEKLARILSRQRRDARLVELLERIQDWKGAEAGVEGLTYADVVDALGYVPAQGGGASYEIATYTPGRPTADERLISWEAQHDVTVETMVISVVTVPAATATFQLQRIDDDGTLTSITTVDLSTRRNTYTIGADIDGETAPDHAGDVFEVLAPSTPDTDMAGIRVSCDLTLRA
jgi:hypothetical protein